MLTPPVMPKSRLALSQVALPALPVRWDEAPLCVHSAARGGLEKCRNPQKKSVSYIFPWRVDRQGYEPVSRVRKSVSLPSTTPSICLCTSSPFLPVPTRPQRMCGEKPCLLWAHHFWKWWKGLQSDTWLPPRASTRKPCSRWAADRKIQHWDPAVPSGSGSCAGRSHAEKSLSFLNSCLAQGEEQELIIQRTASQMYFFINKFIWGLVSKLFFLFAFKQRAEISTI